LEKRHFEVPLDAHNIVILCVDDEELPLTLRKLVLEKQGFRVITANSAAAAMRILDSQDVDLVLTDQLMPGGTGTDLAISVKEVRPSLPVILISGVNEIPPDAKYANLFISKVDGPTAMGRKILSVLSEQGYPVR
jgi:DNA-binding NtrC family response regulator